MSVAKVLLILLAVWVVIGIIGFVVKALFFLFVVALVGFGVTALVGARRRGILGRR